MELHEKANIESRGPDKCARRSDPTHPMFGDVAQDLVRMPLASPSGMGGGRGDKRISWEKVAANIAHSIYDCMGRYSAKTELWYTRNPNYNITKQENGKTIILRQQTIVPLMASQPN